MAIVYDWKDSGETVYCFRKDNGLIVGMVHKISHTEVYLAKIITGNEELILGRYINQEHAKQALFIYWDIENRTLLENV